MGRIARYQPGEVGDIGEFHRNACRQFELRERFTGAANPANLPFGIVEGGLDRMGAPETR